MEGLYFEVKPKKGESCGTKGSEKPTLISNHQSCPSFSHLTSSTKIARPINRTVTWGGKMDKMGEEEEEEEEEEQEVQYKLNLVGYLPVHHLTTMAMLPWVVAEISRSHPTKKEPGTRMQSVQPGQWNRSTSSQMVSLHVSASWVRCVSVLGEGAVWDPLTHTVLFECHPHQVTKLIHNSQEPSSFGCLVKKMSHCACHVFQCQDSTKVCTRVCECKRHDVQVKNIITVLNHETLENI